MNDQIEEVEVWKVLTSEKTSSGGKLPNITSIVYSEEEFTGAHPIMHKYGYDLLAFGNLHDARAFQHYYTDEMRTHIWRAIATGVRDPQVGMFSQDLWEALDVNQDTHRVELETLISRAHFDCYEPWHWPQGTVMCDQIKLVERV